MGRIYFISGITGLAITPVLVIVVSKYLIHDFGKMKEKLEKIYG